MRIVEVLLAEIPRPSDIWGGGKKKTTNASEVGEKERKERIIKEKRHGNQVA